MNSTHPHFSLAARAIDLIVRERHDQPSLDVLSDRLHVSKFHLQRIFSEYVGVSPKKFLQHVNIGDARRALALGASTLDATYAAGLSSPSRLHDLFLSLEGCTPGQFKGRGRGVELRWCISPTVFGPALIAASQVGICYVSFGSDRTALLTEVKATYPAAALIESDSPLLNRAAARLNGMGISEDTRLRLELVGTDFQQSVWRALLAIPEGQLATYGDIARAVGRPGAGRAVGSAVGKNRLAILIPCHRVIRATGAIGQYRWGAERKAGLIARERALS